MFATLRGNAESVLWFELSLLYFDDGPLEVGDYVLVNLLYFVYVFELARWLAHLQAPLA